MPPVGREQHPVVRVHLASFAGTYQRRAGRRSGRNCFAIAIYFNASRIVSRRRVWGGRHRSADRRIESSAQTTFHCIFQAGCGKEVPTLCIAGSCIGVPAPVVFLWRWCLRVNTSGSRQYAPQMAKRKPFCGRTRRNSTPGRRASCPRLKLVKVLKNGTPWLIHKKNTLRHLAHGRIRPPVYHAARSMPTEYTTRRHEPSA